MAHCGGEIQGQRSRIMPLVVDPLPSGLQPTISLLWFRDPTMTFDTMSGRSDEEVDVSVFRTLMKSQRSCAKSHKEASGHAGNSSDKERTSMNTGNSSSRINTFFMDWYKVY